MFVEHLEIKAAYKGCYYRVDPEAQIFFILYLSQYQFDPGAHFSRHCVDAGLLIFHRILP